MEGGPPKASRRFMPRACELFMEHVNAGRANET